MKSSLLLVSFLFLACAPLDPAGSSPAAASARVAPGADLETATFAGGCFWCVEAPFEKVPGVAEVLSGYTGGFVDQPTYKQVCGGETGHTEAVQIRFDPRRVSYADLLEVLWRQINPTDAGGQFVDRGSQYRSEIFYHDDDQRQVAERSRAALAASGRFDAPIVTPITAAVRFYPAEDYHQDYYLKSPGNYQRYRTGSGRDQYLDKVWGKDRKYVPAAKEAAAYSRPAAAELREKLSPMQYHVTQEEGTEPPFKNAFWDNKQEGLYVDVVTGEPLFSSRHKFKSGTGWPSFYQPLSEGLLTEKTDHKLGYARTEVRSKIGDSHLGHLFPDGPKPTGQRYCINSAAMRFIPKELLEAEGYGQFESLFAD